MDRRNYSVFKCLIMREEGVGTEMESPGTKGPLEVHSRFRRPEFFIATFEEAPLKKNTFFHTPPIFYYYFSLKK